MARQWPSLRIRVSATLCWLETELERDETEDPFLGPPRDDVIESSSFLERNGRERMTHTRVLNNNQQTDTPVIKY